MLDRVNTALRRLPEWVVYLLLLVPFGALVVQLFTGGLGIDPVKSLEHGLGERALQILILGLAVTPLRRQLGLNLLKFRRAIGLMAFFYVAMHLLVWLVLDVQILSQVWADILKRPYITVGMGAFALMIPLAVTSNNASIRKLGKRWRQLHKVTYAICLLGAVHFLMLVKGFQWEPLIYMGVIVLLLVLRIPLPRLGRQLA